MKNKLGWVLALCFLALFLLGINELPVNIRVGSITPQLDDTDKIAVSLYGTGGGAADEPIRMEANTSALVIIDHQDEQVHTGAEHEASGTMDLGNGASFDILIVVSDTIESAMTFEVDSEAECSYTLNEDATTSNDGTLVSIFNRNRNSANVAATLVYTTPTVSTVGTTIRNRHWGSRKSDSSLNRGGWATILKQSAKYLLRITNETASNNYICWILRWHED